VLHDSSNVLLELSKLAYLGKYKLASQFFFFGFFFSWVFFRVYWFPAEIIKNFQTHFFGMTLVLYGLDLYNLGGILRTLKATYWTGNGELSPTLVHDSDSYDSDASLSSTLRENPREKDD